MRYLITLLLLLAACEQKPQSTKQIVGHYNIIEIEGCEYVEYDYGVLDQRVYSIAHKGNCKHCAKSK